MAMLRRPRPKRRMLVRSRPMVRLSTKTVTLPPSKRRSPSRSRLLRSPTRRSLMLLNRKRMTSRKTRL